MINDDDIEDNDDDDNDDKAEKEVCKKPQPIGDKGDSGIVSNQLL